MESQWNVKYIGNSINNKNPQLNIFLMEVFLGRPLRKTDVFMEINYGFWHRIGVGQNNLTTEIRFKIKFLQKFVTK